ncbi:MAG: hypothetical protein QW231_01055 [Candidatus Bathyarchaeia archaeon]
MSVVTVRVDEDLKAKMEKLKHVNWSEVIRKAIAERVMVEEALTARRTINMSLLEEAMKDQDRLRAKTTGRWSGVEEIRKWRELRR